MPRNGETAFDHLAGAERVRTAFAPDESGWSFPDTGVLRLYRRAPPSLPLKVFGPWEAWIAEQGEAAACPVSYVVGPLLAAASALIGNARWPQAGGSWSEPPHLWVAAVGDSGTGKSPGADGLLGKILPVVEHNMRADFPDRLQEWKASAEMMKAREEQWRADVRDAQKAGKPPPAPPPPPGPEPQEPRLRQNDVTIERVASLLATTALKGLLIVRDELAGWICGMNVYNDSGRAFWIEAFGGRQYRVERQKNPEPIIVPHLAVAVSGGVQPERLTKILTEADDGLLSRILWCWPEPIPFALSRHPPRTDWAIEALDRLRMLDLMPGDPAQPIPVPLSHEALAMLEKFGRDMQKRATNAGGLMRSAFGKARGLALRLSLVLEFLWWCGEDGMSAPPAQVSLKAFAAAACLMTDYFVPMAERVFGDAGATEQDRNAATLARWIIDKRPHEVYVRSLQREVRLPGLTTAEKIHAAAKVLVEADWLRNPPKVEGHRGRAAYPVNPQVREAPL
jgi:hypothetical protein